MYKMFPLAIEVLLYFPWSPKQLQSKGLTKSAPSRSISSLTSKEAEFQVALQTKIKNGQNHDLFLNCKLQTNIDPLSRP